MQFRTASVKLKFRKNQICSVNYVQTFICMRGGVESEVNKFA